MFLHKKYRSVKENIFLFGFRRRFLISLFAIIIGSSPGDFEFGGWIISLAGFFQPLDFIIYYPKLLSFIITCLGIFSIFS
jgi:hypothetical protein